MSQFHRPEDEKRSIVVIPESQRMDWLKCHYTEAMNFLNPMSDEFTASPKPRLSKNKSQTDLF